MSSKTANKCIGKKLMTTTGIKQIIERNKDGIAFVAGNGINRYPNTPDALSRDDLLIQLYDRVSLQTLIRIPIGISLTEFCDIPELEKTQDITFLHTRKLNLYKQVYVCQGLNNIEIQNK